MTDLPQALPVHGDLRPPRPHIELRSQRGISRSLVRYLLIDDRVWRQRHYQVLRGDARGKGSRVASILDIGRQAQTQSLLVFD